jgi:hypothetical protein
MISGVAWRRAVASAAGHRALPSSADRMGDRWPAGGDRTRSALGWTARHSLVPLTEHVMSAMEWARAGTTLALWMLLPLLIGPVAHHAR